MPKALSHEEFVHFVSYSRNLRHVMVHELRVEPNTVARVMQSETQKMIDLFRAGVPLSDAAWSIAYSGQPE